MVSLWPWRGDASSPASFEKTLSTLSAKIARTQAQLDGTRTAARRAKVLSILYLSFAYLVYAIVLLLVVGWKNMGVYEWSGMSGFPVLIYIVRMALTTYYNFRIETLSARLKDQQTERAKTIQKLKDATKYDSTLQLLERYGGAEETPSRQSTPKAEGGPEGAKGASDKQHRGAGGVPRRTNMPPPATANIPRDPVLGPYPGGSGPLQSSPSSYPGPVELDASAEFAPNAFDRPPAPAIMPTQREAMTGYASHWYDRILDLLLGEDETAAKNRIVLLCSRCRLVNGQAPPGTKSLSEVGMWKCMACGAMNGEVDEGTRIIKEVLGRAASPSPSDTGSNGGIDGHGASSSRLDGPEEGGATREETPVALGPSEGPAGGTRKRRGKGAE